jgi:hypothetical protein
MAYLSFNANAESHSGTALREESFGMEDCKAHVIQYVI